MKINIVLFFMLLSTLSANAQFTFSGEVSDEFIGSNAYLVLIDDYKKSDLFLTNQIIQEVPIDENGTFKFLGDFLSKENRFYKIYIDQCNDDVTDFNHLLNHCDNSNSILFIANNSDQLYFPLNDFEQMFCSLEYSRPENLAIHKIDSLQEVLLSNLQVSKSDAQRDIIFNNYFEKIQTYSQTFNEPLAELYAYHLYANSQSFTRDYYLSDLTNSPYYQELLGRLETAYPNSVYTNSFSDDIEMHNFKSANKTVYIIISILGLLLLLSIIINVFLLKKRRVKSTRINYKVILSSQEQKVFELMNHGNTNKEIAEQLFISVSTVKSHINNIYSKLKIGSRKEISNFF